MPDPNREVGFTAIVLPVLFLFGMILWGLVIGPNRFGIPPFPLEVIFLSAACFTIGELLYLGFSWEQIIESVVAKLAKGFPAILILFAIGLIIGSWMICGTIPMLVTWGIELIRPQFIYVLAFLVPIVFSLLTGTSWGSVGTIGAVIIGIALVIQADLGICAGAIIGGAYFGDKMSPLSDTTNIAAIATEVDLYDHIRSMYWTTIPSAIIALMVYGVVSFVFPVQSNPEALIQNREVTTAIRSLFHFHWILLLPPLVVLVGSFRRWPTLPVLLSSVILSVVLALIVQPFSLSEIVATLNRGFQLSFADEDVVDLPILSTLFERGGLYALNEAIIFTLMVFVFVGALDLLDAMPRLVRKLLGSVPSRKGLVLSSLFAAGITNALTANQSATSFIVGDAFRKRYDDLGIDRAVLSRSIEDYGTMLESIVPWTASAIFMVATLGVPFSDYWHWQILSLANLIVAPGIALFFLRDRTLE
ncbi:MAG: Na+/H+ antiporter NhaC family protein [Bacteroidota bacterium]